MLWKMLFTGKGIPAIDMPTAYVGSHGMADAVPKTGKHEPVRKKLPKDDSSMEKRPQTPAPILDSVATGGPIPVQPVASSYQGLSKPSVSR